MSSAVTSRLQACVTHKTLSFRQPATQVFEGKALPAGEVEGAIIKSPPAHVQVLEVRAVACQRAAEPLLEGHVDRELEPPELLCGSSVGQKRAGHRRASNHVPADDERQGLEVH